MPSIWVDDVPLEDYGLWVSSLQNWWSPPGQSFLSSGIPGRRGSRATDRGATTAPRRIPLRVIVDATTLAQRLARLDALAAALTGMLEVRVADDPERVAYGTLESGSVDFYSTQLTDPQVTPTYELVFADPHKYDRMEQMLVCPTALLPKAIPCGSVPHRGRLWVMDTLGSRTVEVVAGDGRVLSQLRLTGTLASGEYLEIDMDRDAPIITHVTSSGTVRTDAFDWLNPFDAFPVFDPQDRPTLRHTGSGDLVLFYRRAYHT